MGIIIKDTEKPMSKWSLKRRVSENLYWIQDAGGKVSKLDLDVREMKLENLERYTRLSADIRELKCWSRCLVVVTLCLFVLFLFHLLMK